MSLDQAITEVRREIAMRKKLYPRWVAAGKVPREKAEHQLAAMELALLNLEDVKEVSEKLSSLPL